MSSIDEIRSFDTIDKPEGLIIEVVHDPVEFFNRKVTLNKGSKHWFGSAMRQGNRLQFVTTMTISDYLDVAKVEQAERGSTITALNEKSNRPKIGSQHKLIKDYLKETACAGDKWIFPNFMLNYGVGWTDQLLAARLILLVTDPETLAWPAIFEPPSGMKLPSTDGGHRTGSMKDLIDKEKPDGLDALLNNGVGVTIVMEASDVARRQDFADAGKSRGVSESVKATWDLREVVSRAARELVVNNPFLHKYVDATSPSVNLSSNSVLLWSMSAVRGSLANAVSGSHQEFDKLTKQEKEEALAGVPESVGAFIDALVERLPLFQQLIAKSATPAVFRKQRGGCVLMRGAGFGLLMRAYRYAGVNGIPWTEMADRLAQVDWFLFPSEEMKIQVPPDRVFSFLKENAAPAWFKLVVVNPGDGTWRLKGTNDNLDAAFAEMITPAQAAE